MVHHDGEVIPRRDLLRCLPSVTAGLLVTTSREQVAAAPSDDDLVFAHGVASGDPTAERVVIWTRVSGTEGDDQVAVSWTMAADPELRDVVAGGEVEAGPETDWTVHVDIDGLRPATTWWYAFEVRGQRSPTGRTRTAPTSEDGQELRLGIVSCASYASGYFGAYRHLADRDLDLVVHLGDYLYESDAGASVREHVPSKEPVSLADYRLRHAQYKTDADLQALHQRFAVAAVWDDHEVAGNAWEGGASGHNPATQGPWSERRAAALRAYLEWMPLRRPDPDAPERIWRSLPLGANGELILIDTRHDGRDRQVGSHLSDPAAALADPGRRIMSDDQEGWVAERLRNAPGTWRVVANQVVLSPLNLEIPEPLAELADRLGSVVAGKVMNPDQWDGYPAARRRLLDVVSDEAVGPVVVLTGDIHSSWAFEVPAGGDAGAPPVAVELVTPSVTSETLASIVGPDSELVARGLAGLVEDQLPHVRLSEIRHHGYLVVSLTPERLQGDWWHVDAVDEAATGERLAASWTTQAGVTRLEQAAAGLAVRARPAPPEPPGNSDGGLAGESLLWPFGVGAGALAVGGAVLALRRRRKQD
ncbi:hypothetical protein BH24ACT1_BH24ACT1_11090 [soil metagenome]